MTLIKVLLNASNLYRAMYLIKNSEIPDDCRLFFHFFSLITLLARSVSYINKNKHICIFHIRNSSTIMKI